MISLAFLLLSAEPATLLETGIVRVRTFLKLAYLFLKRTLVDIQTKQSKKIFAKIQKGTYLTRFSEAMTLVDTALPRACSSMVSWISR